MMIMNDDDDNHTDYNAHLFNLVLILLIIYLLAPVYQLGANKVCLTGQLLMSAGLPGMRQYLIK